MVAFTTMVTEGMERWGCLQVFRDRTTGLGNGLDLGVRENAPSRTTSAFFTGSNTGVWGRGEVENGVLDMLHLGSEDAKSPFACMLGGLSAEVRTGEPSGDSSADSGFKA